MNELGVRVVYVVKIKRLGAFLLLDLPNRLIQMEV